MPLRKSNATPPPAASALSAPSPSPRKAKAAGRRRRLLLALAPALFAAAWGAWSLWRPDPLREAREALDRRDFARATELLDRRLAERADDAQARLLAAQAARRDKHLPTAQEHLRAYRDRHGSDPGYELEASLLRIQGGDMAEAERAFAAYSRRLDSPEAALVMEAYLVGKLRVLAPAAHEHYVARPPAPGVLDPLRQAVDAWLRLRPGRADQVQGRVWKARVARLAVDHPAASAALHEAVELDPDHFEARFHLALSLLESRPDEAREHLERLVAREPGNEFLRYGLANTYRTLGRTQDARRLLEGLRSGPTELSALLQLAGIDMDEGKLADAEPRIRRVLAQAPNNTEANAAMSRFLQLSGRPAEAEAYRKRFDELDAERLKNSAPKQ